MVNNQKHSIYMKYQLSEKECQDIKNLEDICYEKQKTNLKLELDFKMSQRENFINNKIMIEFLYYDDETLIGYLGLCNFGRDVVEVSGMVHPEFRRKRIFKKLYVLAKEEWEKICPSQVLLLCDHTSHSGLSFINSLKAEYASSEYKMCLNKHTATNTDSHGIKLRVATRDDAPELYRQDTIYFGLIEKEVDAKKIDENIEKVYTQTNDDSINYMAELDGKVIGKIRINTADNEGFIYGFGVLPEFRGKGYGREALSCALDILKKKNLKNIFLEVATENKNALGLYESCGFEEISVMDYFVVS